MWCLKMYLPHNIFILFIVLSNVRASDKPCAARAKSDSVDCVCNFTYCDEVTREVPALGKFIAYTSTKSGLRFSKTTGSLNYYWFRPTTCLTTLSLNPNILYQTIEGFGGAMTDSAAGLWANFTDQQVKNHLINSYFSSSGIEYNMVRFPIGASDFSPNIYSYQDYPMNDSSLSNFSLAYEDYQYKIPMFQAASKVSPAPIHPVASAWSPPLWMKTSYKVSGVARMKKEYYNALATYHYKFLEHYAAAGVNIWGLTTTNEPLSGIMSLGNNLRVTWTTSGLGKWIAKHMGPMLRNSKFKDVKFIVGDDNRMTVGLWFTLLISETPEALRYIDGVGVHNYFDDFTPPDIMTAAVKDNQDKFLLYTESSLGIDGQLLGNTQMTSWEKAQKYIVNILENLNYNVTGFIDWNMCLNPEGGPAWSGIQLDAPIIIHSESEEFVKQPLFYAMGHFSKFLPRGSRRIAGVGISSCESGVENVSFLTPDNTVVTVLHNGADKEHLVQVNVGYPAVRLTLPPASVTTLEFPYDVKTMT